MFTVAKVLCKKEKKKKNPVQNLNALYCIQVGINFVEDECF